MISYDFFWFSSDFLGLSYDFLWFIQKTLVDYNVHLPKNKNVATIIILGVRDMLNHYVWLTIPQQAFNNYTSLFERKQHLQTNMGSRDFKNKTDATCWNECQPIADKTRQPFLWKNKQIQC